MRLGFVASALLALAALAWYRAGVCRHRHHHRQEHAADGRDRRRGQEIYWPVSTGARGYTTPSGTYTAFRMEKDHFSEEWDDAPMPHSIFFTHKGHAIHGSNSRLGVPVSHGCVRLAPQNAAILYNLVERRGLDNTRVVVTDRMPIATGKSDPTRPSGKKKGKKFVSPFYFDQLQSRWQ